MRLKLQLFYKLFLIILLFSYGLVIAAGIFPAVNLVCPPGDAKRNRDRLKTHWLGVFSAIVSLHVIKEGEHSGQSALLVSNHISWLDIIVIGQYLPASFVAKSDILSWPLIGYLARQGGTIFIHRGNKRHIKTTAEKMLWLLKQNSNIIAFPEGTTTNGNDVLNFHASLFQPAVLTRSPIQPIAIQYLGAAKEQAPFIGDDDFIPHLIRMLSLDKIEVRVSFLPVINSLGKDRNSINIEARNLILEKISHGSLAGFPCSMRETL